MPVQTGERVARVIAREARPRPTGRSPPTPSSCARARPWSTPSTRTAWSSAPAPSGPGRLRELYGPILERSGAPFLATDRATAELIKHASNAFLATKISFINSVARVCERSGADVELVARGMGLDPRIGVHFLKAGAGYGGSCFPKDVAAFAHRSRELGVDFGILNEVAKINHEARRAVVDKVRDALWHLDGKRIGMLGLSFKPNTDDLREAPSIDVARDLLADGAQVVAYDPVAGERRPGRSPAWSWPTRRSRWPTAPTPWS